jgi:tetraacyldisaccharide 4'-kinase
MKSRNTFMNAIDWSNFHLKKEKNLFTYFLKILSCLYSLAVRCRLGAYRIGLLRVKRLPTHVISVGNITTGGTGKTPFVAMLAEWAGTHGCKVAVLSRGYKGKKNADALVVSDGKNFVASADNAGDEPVMLAKKLPSVPILVSKKRYDIGYMAIKRFYSDLLLLDDGYQHLSLYRDVNILLIDAKRGFGNESLLPLGPLREPIEQIKRADTIILTGCTNEHTGGKLIHYIHNLFPEKSIYRAEHVPNEVIFPLAHKTYSPDMLNGRNVVVFAGIAHPDDFLETVESYGAHVIHFKAFSDHHSFRKHEIEKLSSWEKQSNVDFLLTTEKDWVRITPTIPSDWNIAMLTIKIELIAGTNSFFDHIKQGILKAKKINNPLSQKGTKEMETL